MGLSSDELEVLRAWPEFQVRLEQHRVAKAQAQIEKDQAEAARVRDLWPLCVGGSYCQHHTEEGFKVWCSMCGNIFYPKNEQERGRLWNIIRRPHCTTQTEATLHV